MKVALSEKQTYYKQFHIQNMFAGKSMLMIAMYG